MDVRVFPVDEWAEGTAAVIADTLPQRGNVVITGGGSAAQLYPALAARNDGWDAIEIFFSDDRAVPPNSHDSNYHLALATLLNKITTGPVHRMRGEASPDEAAEEYAHDIAGRRMDLMILGLGEDAHVAALFPGSGALDEERLCVAVKRPDGMDGITLTPPVLLGADKVLFVVTGAAKANAVARSLRGDEPPSECPARLFASHRDVTFLVDDPAAAHI